jgi:hypothetical protein
MFRIIIITLALTWIAVHATRPGKHISGASGSSELAKGQQMTQRQINQNKRKMDINSLNNDVSITAARSTSSY